MPEQREKQQRGYESKKLQGPLFFHKDDYCADDRPSIDIGAQLGGASGWPGLIYGLYLADRHPEIKRVDGQFSLGLEPKCNRRERLDEAAAKNAMARQHVGQTIAEDRVDDSAQDASMAILTIAKPSRSATSS